MFSTSVVGDMGLPCFMYRGLLGSIGERDTYVVLERPQAKQRPYSTQVQYLVEIVVIVVRFFTDYNGNSSNTGNSSNPSLQPCIAQASRC